MLSQDEAGKVVYASSFSKTVCPGIRVGYLVGPQAVIKQIQTIATNTYISPNMVAQSIVNQFCRSGRIDALDRDGQGRAARRAATRSSPRSSASCRRRRFAPPAGRLLHVGRAARGRRRGRARGRRRRERGVLFVKGTDFLLEGGREHAAPRLLGRDAGADRRGRHPAGRGGRARSASPPDLRAPRYGDEPLAVRRAVPPGRRRRRSRRGAHPRRLLARRATAAS